MGILDEIAKGGSQFQPITAFLVGRESRLNRERQGKIDQQNQVSSEVINELRKAQTDALKNPQAPETFTALTSEQKRGLGIPEESFAQVSNKTGKIRIDDPPKTPVTNINLPSGQRIENAADKALGTSVGEVAGKRLEEARGTIAEDNDLMRVRIALDRGAQTGFGEETILNLKSLGNTLFNIPFDEADGEAEVVRKIGNEAALRLRNPNSGLGLSGSTSNRDLDFLKASVVNLQKTELGNSKIIEFTLRKNKLKRDIAAEQARIIAENGGIPADLDQRLLDFANNYEFLTPEEKEELRVLNAQSHSLVERIFSDPENQSVLDDILSRD